MPKPKPMKASELIGALQHILKTEGDLPIRLTLANPEDRTGTMQGPGLFVDAAPFDDGRHVEIRDFPY